MKKIYITVLLSMLTLLSACNVQSDSTVSSGSVSVFEKTEETTEAPTLPMVTPKDMRMKQMDDRHLIIDTLPEFDYTTVLDEWNYESPSMKFFEQFDVQFYKKLYDDRYENYAIGYSDYSEGYPGYRYYSFIKTNKGYIRLGFTDHLEVGCGGIRDISFSDDDTEEKIKSVQTGEGCFDVMKKDPDGDYTDFNAGRRDYPFCSYHYYRRGVFYQIRYNEDGDVIDVTEYTM